jgi:hypothetical protein
MKRLMQLVLFFIVALMVLTVVFYSLMGWSGLGLMLVLLVAGAMYLKSMAGKLIQKAFVSSFVMKGKVLKGASTQIHSIETATRPARTFVQDYQPADDTDNDSDRDTDAVLEDEEEDEDSENYNRYFSIDMTITPQATDGPFQSWEPGELILVKPGTRSGDFDDDDAAVGSVFDVQVGEAGTWTEDEGMKYAGPQRVKLLAGVMDGVNSCRFRYYFEVFGQVEFVDSSIPDSL